MNMLMKIQLKDVRLSGFHGLEKGEEVVGGEFEVNLTVSYKPTNNTILSISDTIDYTALLNLVKQRMRTPAHLLETLATEMASEIIAKFPVAVEVEISIFKLHPPIENFQGSVGVTYIIKK